MSRSTGTPTWIDYGSNDFDVSLRFYESLFGWRFEDSGEDMGHYNIIRNEDGAFVGGAMDCSGMTMPDGSPLPASWTIYLAVDDANAIAAKAEQHGAEVALAPSDAGGAGRFAILVDPTGANFGIWQAGDVDGYAESDAVGTPYWFEVMTQDFPVATQFYTQVLSFDLTMMGDGYAMNGSMESATSGICDASGFIPAELGSFWRFYASVDDCDAACELVRELGGDVLDGPQDSPFGRLATVADPVGATFQIIDTSKATAQ